MQNIETEPTNSTESFIVPPQLEGLHSKLIREAGLLPSNQYIDEDKNLQQSARNEGIISELERLETAEAESEEAKLSQAYGLLSEDDRTLFSIKQTESTELIENCIKGNNELLESDLSAAEFLLLGEMRDSYAKFKRNGQEDKFIPELKGTDNLVLGNLIQKQALKLVDAASQTTNTAETSPEDDKYSTFEQRDGDTMSGEYYWHEYRNQAINTAKDNGSFEWGKERIYFEVPESAIDTMTALMKASAATSKVPVAFKSLDLDKTSTANTQDGKVTRMVANFVNTSDAKRFYESLSQQPGYADIKPDRDVDYSGYRLDEVATYANGFREKRDALKRIVNGSMQPDGRHAYIAENGRKITIDDADYRRFLDQYNNMPDSANVWQSA